MTKFETLYQKYADTFPKFSRYQSGNAIISEQDLLDNLAADLENIINDYGSFDEYAEPDDVCILDIYTLREGQWLLNELMTKLSSS